METTTTPHPMSRFKNRLLNCNKSTSFTVVIAFHPLINRLMLKMWLCIYCSECSLRSVPVVWRCTPAQTAVRYRCNSHTDFGRRSAYRLSVKRKHRALVTIPFLSRWNNCHGVKCIRFRHGNTTCVVAWEIPSLLKLTFLSPKCRSETETATDISDLKCAAV